MTRFSVLDTFLKAWFHQDFDLDGDVPEVIARYRASATPGEVAALRRDIDSFLAAARADADSAFEHEFQAGIDPAGWNMTARAWLEWIAHLLADGPAAA
jgi:hypothetical protein